MSPELERVTLHHWLKDKHDLVFHAYASANPGTKSMCEEGARIRDWQTMEIPGERSMCCINCMTTLFGYRPPAINQKGHL